MKCQNKVIEKNVKNWIFDFEIVRSTTYYSNEWW